MYPDKRFNNNDFCTLNEERSTGSGAEVMLAFFLLGSCNKFATAWNCEDRYEITESTKGSIGCLSLMLLEF